MQTQHRTGNNIHYDCVLSAWREQITTAANGLELKRRLLYQERELLPAFAAQYTKLAALPRTARRAMQRQWKRSLAGVALLLAVGQTPAMAATINVGGGCTLADAITAANSDAAMGGCSAGSGADTIVLLQGSTQMVSTASTPRCLLPPVESVITLAGNGSIIRAQYNNIPELQTRVICVNDGGNLAVQRTTITGAAGASRLRGLQIYEGGQATLTNATISRIAGSGVSNEGSLRITNSTISGNTDGGIINDGSVTVTNSTISDNTADVGGGIFNDRSATVINSTISGNTEGIFNDNYSSATVTNSTISGNTNGGITSYSRLTLINSTISGNSDRVGGGVTNVGGYMTIINSTITRNSATVAGGGVSTESSYGYIGGDLTLKKTLISGNNAPAGREVFAELSNGTLRFNSFNVFGFNRNAGIAGFKKGATDIVPSVGLGKVLKTTLVNNRGPTRTHALPAGSPAIDTVNDGTCPPPARDQRGTTRPRDGDGDGGVACDTGAFERGPRPATPNRRAMSNRSQ